MLVCLKNMPKQKTLLLIILVLAGIGLMDSTYLTYEHYSNVIPPCSNSVFIDCGKVLDSSYSKVFGIPLALLGMIHYSVLFGVSYLVFRNRNLKVFKLMAFLIGIGVFASLYFVYLQLYVIEAICIYCMVSAINSFILGGLLGYITHNHEKYLKKMV